MLRAGILAPSVASITRSSRSRHHNAPSHLQSQRLILASYIMRHRHHHLSSQQSGAKQTRKGKFGSFASRAFVATATASASFAAYYLATAVLFGSAAAVGADTDGNGLFEKKIEDKYGIEYIGFDSYPGLDLDDGSGVATKEVKAECMKVVSRALDSAGLDETTGIKKGITGISNGEDNTLHPKHVHRVGLGKCPVYGCPFLPLDVHYDDDARAQLDVMRGKDSPGKDEGEKKPPVIEEEKKYMLKSSGSEKAATLTLIGYKGGRLEDQINQDRALALAPYEFWNIDSDSTGGDDNNDKPVARLIGAFDGHARYGEKVSEYVSKTLPALLGSKLINYMNTKGNYAGDKRQVDQDIGQILHDTFLELDATSPADPSGGCTASAVLQIGHKIYIANAGDSRSFIAVRIAPPAGGEVQEEKTSVIYVTREDKPHLTTERERVEHMGGTVYLPNGFLATGKGTTRVLYIDPTTGGQSGLAMSRSIGDWDAGEVGVIPDPLIDVLDMRQIKKRVLEKMNENCNNDAEASIDPSGEAVVAEGCHEYTEKDVQIFAISATDGLMDYLSEDVIASHVAKSLYGKNAGVSDEAKLTGDAQVSHPLLACEDVIYAAAQGWQDDKGGRYRDDIAVAIADLEIE